MTIAARGLGRLESKPCQAHLPHTSAEGRGGKGRVTGAEPAVTGGLATGEKRRGAGWGGAGGGIKPASTASGAAASLSAPDTGMGIDKAKHVVKFLQPLQVQVSV